MILLCTGIFTWNGSERRSNRYGSFWMSASSYNGEIPATPPKLHHDAINSLVGKRVRVEVKVVEGRPSGHIGDLFLGIFPNPLPVGRSIELAIGTLFTKEQDGQQTLIVQPDQPRSDCWIDPRILYQLHDQTVEVWAEESSAPAHPEYSGTAATDEAIVTESTADSATLQVKTRNEMEGMRVPPTIEAHGDGLFVMSQPLLTPGSRHRLTR